MRLVLASDARIDDMYVEIYDGDCLIASVSENTGEVEIYPKPGNLVLKLQLRDFLDSLEKAQSLLDERASPSGRESRFRDLS
jgi:hypothetical protein